jgi:cellulose synthase/poly-beta-1,6-N-acetylglucosamine synthase-like glycosyltransferase
MLVILFWFCIIAVIYGYIGYPILLTAGSLFFSKGGRKYNVAGEWPRVDMLIVAYNEEKVIGSRLKNCLTLDYPADKLRVWVVSDGSIDKTNEIVQKYAFKDGRICLVALERTGKSGAINKAVSLLSGDIIVFSDANTEFESRAVKNLVRNFQDNTVGCVCGRLIYRNPDQVISGKGEGLYWRYETMLKKLESGMGYVSGANGAIYSIRRGLFENLPDGTINDDFMISMKIVGKKFKCIYEENAIAYEEVASTMKHEFKRHIRDGAGHYIAVSHLTGLLNPMLGVRSFIYWSHRIVRWVLPFIFVGLFCINALLLAKSLYQAIFIMQCIFYVLAIVGLLTIRYKHLPFIIYVPFYICNLNVALLIGFFKAISGRQKMTWERTERAVL